MRPIEQICRRIRWDDRFDPARFVLGVRQRDDRIKSVPLESFTAAGEVPWHRVRRVEADGQVVWDRDTGTDLLDTTTAGRRTAPRGLPAPFFTPSTPHAWTDRGWRPAVAEPALPPEELRVVTWNTLWDRYDAERIHTARRRPLLLAELEAADADLIALQEVEPALVKQLLAQPWVRDGYTLGADPFAREIDGHGLLLLSRLPVLEAGRHALGPHKAVTAIAVRTAAGPLTVAAVHLSSDHSADGAGRRRAELAELATGFAAVEGELLVLGDFNDSTSAPADALGLRDAWTELHGPEDRTPTFDPVANPLAAVSSLTGRAGRLDRVLLRPGRARTATARLLGDRPDADGLHPSDHYGLAVGLGFGAAPAVAFLDAPPTARTAVAWLPPEELWPPIQRLRAAYDPQAERWPPHVNLLFGFVAEHEWDAALPLLAEAAAEVPQFTAELAGVRTFGQRLGHTLWLDPAAGSAAPWAALGHALERRFPRCRARAEGYRPHLTLGRAEDPRRAVAECTATLGPMTAPVGELVVLSRRGDGPMLPRATVALGTGELRTLPEPAAPARTEPPVELAELMGRIAAALPGEVHLVGSRRLGCALPGADLDLVAVLPGAVEPAGMAGQLAAALPEARNLREVRGARVPGLRLDVRGLAVDLVLAPADGPAEDFAVAYSAVTDAEAVLAAVGDRHRAFAALARRVKAWTGARGLHGAPFGQLPSLAWTVLAARTVRENAEDDPEELFRHFTGTWAAWDWRQPVTLLGGPAAPHPDPVTVLTPTAPVRSCTGQVGAGTRDLIAEELYRAWELGPDHPELLAPPPLHRRHAAWLVLTCTPERLGPVRGRLRALLTALEPAPGLHAWPRLLPGHRLAVGLGPQPPTRETLDRVTADWLRGLPGVTAAHLAGGELDPR
ncbi:RNA repair domain-containing protein [Kitasatospora cheerisanensis]|uniref:Polynucleotide adenylyltransferase n=1 Tax=Kitasatospora cheerisanensis KCTC 2395 TaxID=1348663 RepID=A0A066Z3D6_9ACTN|nr:RNA repair domain-containing protein [Kitasatospora cheerisanensis]KDN84871.1 polynucleotide adenylyltransferase [Kitasatospora cheerisanensis KCTC 2395]